MACKTKNSNRSTPRSKPMMGKNGMEDENVAPFKKRKGKFPSKGKKKGK